MPPVKKDKKDEQKKDTKTIRRSRCVNEIPGPKYSLRPLVGYTDHCLSKTRDPAYTIGILYRSKATCDGPGPKYYYQLPGIPGYTIPRAVYKDPIPCSPAPTYSLPPFTSPAYSIVPRRKERCPPPTPGPFDPPPVDRGPAYHIIGTRGKTKCIESVPIGDVGPVTLIRSNAPAFSIVGRRSTKPRCDTPGPNFIPKAERGPAYKFGIYHSECKRIPRVECDDLC